MYLNIYTYKQRSVESMMRTKMRVSTQVCPSCARNASCTTKQLDKKHVCVSKSEYNINIYTNISAYIKRARFVGEPYRWTCLRKHWLLLSETSRQCIITSSKNDSSWLRTTRRSRDSSPLRFNYFKNVCPRLRHTTRNTTGHVPYPDIWGGAQINCSPLARVSWVTV